MMMGDGAENTLEPPLDPVQARLVPDAPGWSETFYGMLFHPKSMIMALTSAPEHFSDLRGPALSLVFLVFFVIGALRFSPSSGVLSIFTVLGSICNGMALWVTLATIMVTLSKLPKSREVGWNEALVVTGWIFTPLIFMAPISCFKQALGPVFLPVATIPTWWTLFLGLIVFNRTLSTSFVRLLAICMVLPPVLFLIYVFWFGCLACMIVAEILAAMPG